MKLFNVELPGVAQWHKFWADEDDTMTAKLLVVGLAGIGFALHVAVWLYSRVLYALLVIVPLLIIYKLL